MKANISGRILVVDDYPNWQNLLRTILEHAGYEVVTAVSQSEAEEELSSGVFDVVILDMRLVDDQKYNVQGIALLGKIKSQTPTTGAIILTGYPDPIQEERALCIHQADAYLRKVPENPDSIDQADFDVQSFRVLVARLVQKRQR
jgi:CheY-like chemotaxis protein